MYVHRHGVELLEARHGLEEQNHQSAALYRLDGAGQQVGREGFEVLEDKHSERLTQDALCLLVVAPPCSRHQQYMAARR